MLMAEIATAPVVVFCKVTVWEGLLLPTASPAKIKLSVESCTGGAMPVPERTTVSGLSVALSVKTSEAVSTPAAVGENSTLTVQVDPEGKVAPTHVSLPVR